MKLTDKEKTILEMVTKKGVIAEELEGQEKVKDLSIHAIRSTLARLDKTHGLIKSRKVISNDKMKTQYIKE